MNAAASLPHYQPEASPASRKNVRVALAPRPQHPMCRAPYLLFMMLLTLIGQAGCAAKPPPKVEVPTNVIEAQGSVEAGADANPDSAGSASPALVRVYELASDDVFNRLDFFSLFDHEPELLGAALLRVRSFPLAPGQKTDLAGQLDPRTQFVGVIAALRSLDNVHWRVSRPLPPKTVPPSQPLKVEIVVALTRNGVALGVTPLGASEPGSAAASNGRAVQ